MKKPKRFLRLFGITKKTNRRERWIRLMTLLEMEHAKI